MFATGSKAGYRCTTRWVTSKRILKCPGNPTRHHPTGNVTETGGSAVSLDFSPDSNQRLIYLINQNNSQIEIIYRQSVKILSSFGRAGHFPGEFDQPHGIAVDSKGNVYVAENRGKKIQRFRIVGQY